MFGARYTDATSGYIGVRKDCVEKLGIDSDGFEVETLIGILAHRAGLLTSEVPCLKRHEFMAIAIFMLYEMDSGFWER